MEAITGVLSDIRFARDDFIIGRLESGDAILGSMSDPVIGQEYRLVGSWETNPTYGRQFKFNRYQAEIPQSTDGIYRYLVKVAKWVGPVVGRGIIDAFGEQALEVLKHEPQRAALCVKRLTLERAEEISRNLLENEDRETAAVDLEALLGGQHLPKHTIPYLIEKYHSDAPARVRKNPYMLIEVRGIGFPTADRVAMALGHERESLERRIAASLYALEDAADSRGHTWLPAEKHIEKVHGLIGIPPGTDAIHKLLADKKIWNAGNMIALASLARDETDVAGIVRMLSGAEDLSGHASTDLKGLASDQQEAFRLCMANPVFILTGAPGTGKTYTLRRIIQQFTEWNHRIALAAPTGKAAKRMSEMVDMPASTIHRLLGPEPYQDKGETKFSFSYGIGNPLPVDLVVIDEFSMVDISLAASLFRAIAPGTRVLIVGDHYQLPSVGPGAVLRDLLAARVPSYELTEIKRNTGDIVKACHAIKDSRPVIPSPTLDPENGLNLRHIEASDPEHIQQIIRQIVCDRLPLRKGQDGEPYSPVWDVQVLSPMNERTMLSCKDLNEILQGALNIHPPVKGTPFRRGDKVLQRKNEGIGDDFVVNGDLGEILDITDTEFIVMFQYPDRKVRVKRKEHHLVLAYCMTIHKMQGSEAPVVVLPLHSSFGGFFNRELVYTGISRARDICITIGQWGALVAAASRVGSTKRITRLTELMVGSEPVKAPEPILSEFPEFGGIGPIEDDIPF